MNQPLNYQEMGFFPSFHIYKNLPRITVFRKLKCPGSLQSARQRGVRGTVRGVRGMRGMRGTQKIKKILKNIKKYIKYQNAEIVWLVGFF